MKPAKNMPTLTLYGVNYTWMVSKNAEFYQVETPNIKVHILYMKGSWRYICYAKNPEKKRVFEGKAFPLQLKVLPRINEFLHILTEEEVLWTWGAL